MPKKVIMKIKLLWSDKDERNLIVNILLAFGVKGLSLLVSMFSMPLYISYFDNNDVLGVWYTILSILSWITLCDLGLGNGLRNSFTVAYTQKDRELGKKYVTSTYVSLMAIVIPIITVICVIVPFIDLNDFLKLSTDYVDPRSLTVSTIILLVGIAFNFVLKSITAIIYALQKAFVNNVITLAVSILPLAYILFAPSGTQAENLIRLSIVHVVAINLPLLVATVIIFVTKCREYAPSLCSFDLSVAKKMLNVGMEFFLAQIFFMFLMSTNEIFITRLYSSDDVVEYSAYYRIFMLVGSLFMLALTPVWSKVTKDLTEKKYKKIKMTNRVLYVLSAAAVVAEFLIIFALQWIFDFWLKDASFKVETSVAWIFALFGGLYIFNIVLTTVANGMGELRTQNIFYGIGAVLKIPITMLLKTMYDDWSVVIAYNCVVLLVFCVVQIIWVEKRIKKLIKTGGN